MQVNIETTIVTPIFKVMRESKQVAGPDGKPLHDGHGLPKMQDFTVLLFAVPGPTGVQSTKVVLNQDQRDTLVSQLTGGLEIATTMPTV